MNKFYVGLATAALAVFAYAGPVEFGGGGGTTPLNNYGSGSHYDPAAVAITGGTITNVTISGTTVAGYLPLTGGTLSSNLTVNGGVQAGSLFVTNVLDTVNFILYDIGGFASVDFGTDVLKNNGADKLDWGNSTLNGSWLCSSNFIVSKALTAFGVQYPIADGLSNYVLTTYGNGATAFLPAAAGGVSGEAVLDGSRWFGWMTGYGSTVSNAAAPIYWTETGANGDDPAFGFTSSDTVTLQSRYAFAVAPIAQSATGWKTGGNMTVVYRQSSDSAVTNTMALRLSVPGGDTWTTNLVAGAANTITTWTVPVANLPTFVAPTGTSNVTFRCDFQQFAGATNAILVIKLPWQ